MAITWLHHDVDPNCTQHCQLINALKPFDDTIFIMVYTIFHTMVYTIFYSKVYTMIYLMVYTLCCIMAYILAYTTFYLMVLFICSFNTLPKQWGRAQRSQGPAHRSLPGHGAPACTQCVSKTMVWSLLTVTHTTSNGFTSSTLNFIRLSIDQRCTSLVLWANVLLSIVCRVSKTKCL
jgi:hypothetical protein